ncbi:hypothetical protein [Bradyrhizobium sp.]|uniref:hypothetical protein n=1 Tax=Bradyrhizobium sp. TaxID=376 RepID=UPI002DDDACA7|nr:hypothetical protein [Bradyrhizobium sp.]HEV2159480.1 hypothetical protein [Bradyrhizobium sp.]
MQHGSDLIVPRRLHGGADLATIFAPRSGAFDFHKMNILEVEMQFRALSVVLAVFVGLYGCGASAAPLSYGGYYDETAGSLNCAGGNTCRVNFSQTPADKLVGIRKLNCAIGSTTPVTQGFLFAATTNGGPPLPRQLPLPIPSVASAIGGNYYVNFEADAHWLIGQGRFPFVQIQTFGSSTVQMNCTVTGDLVDPIQ